MSLKKQAVSSVKWTSVAQVLQQVAQFATSVVLARLLLPADFGLVAMASVVIGFIAIFKDLGTSAAVIQRKDLSEGLLSSIFWMNAAIGILFMIGLSLAAPLVAMFYREPRVVPLVRALSFVFFVSSLSILQKALLERNLAFRTLAKIETGVMLVSSIAGIGAALLGAGVWSLVLRSVAEGVLSTLLLAIFAHYRPKLIFKWQELKSVAGYSLNLTGFNIANYFTRNADYLLIGRFLGAQDLGYYTLAYRLMLFPLQNISNVIGRVMFPVFSQIQEQNERFRRTYLNVTASIAFVSFPLMFGLFGLSEPFVLTVFGANWKPVATLLLVLAPVGLLQSVGTTVGGIYQAKGRTDWMLQWGLGSGLITVLAFAIGLHWGIVGVASAYFIIDVLIFYPSYAIPFRLIDLKVRTLIATLTRPFLCGMLMLLFLAVLRPPLQARAGDLVLLAVAVPSGAILYFVCSWLFNRETMETILELVHIFPRRLVSRPAGA